MGHEGLDGWTECVCLWGWEGGRNVKLIWDHKEASFVKQGAGEKSIKGPGVEPGPLGAEGVEVLSTGNM